MKKENRKNTDAQLLQLLKKVLPRAVSDAALVDKIYDEVERELRSKSRVTAFDKFCSKVELPDLEPASVGEVKKQLEASFGEAEITLKPNRKEKSLAVEVGLPDGTQFGGEILVNPNAKAGEEEPEFKPKFIPFPVCLPGDKELIWALAKVETLTNEEAGITLTKIEDEFWGSKTGQKLLRDRVERSFPEFIARVPSGMLTELGLKRHYKMPEAIKTLRAKH